MKDFSSLTEMESTISGVLRNEYITSFLIMVISLYSGLVAPNLPYHFTKIFDSHLFNLIALLIIGYLSTKNESIALVLAIAYLITVHTVQKHKVNDTLLILINQDYDKDEPEKVEISKEKYNNIEKSVDVKKNNCAVALEEQPQTVLSESQPNPPIGNRYEDMQDVLMEIEGFNTNEIYSLF